MAVTQESVLTLRFFAELQQIGQHGMVGKGGGAGNAGDLGPAIDGIVLAVQ